MINFILVLIATIILSFLPERLLKPHAPKLSFANIFQQARIVSFILLSLTLIVQRPVFSSIAVLIFLIIMVGISNTKFTTLREPMVFSDFAMFSQAFKHPRLYFPFLGLAPVIIMPLLIIGLIILVLMLEPAMAFTWPRIVATLLALLVLAFTIKNKALSSLLTLEPATDNSKLGLLNSTFAYAFQAGTESHKQLIKQRLRGAPFASTFSVKQSTNKQVAKQSQQNITVIQSESFFDARRLHPSIKSEILKNFDQCNLESTQYGKLKVPAWGANTMRSEFSFLTGLAYEEMGFYRYYPYEYLSKMPVTSIASALQQQGYYCVCIHPHPASFFGRDKIFPQLGFDEFIDGKSFDSKDIFGPYISDEAVTNKIIEITKEKTDKPLFIFVITMENHGPLHLEKISDDEYSSFFNNEKDIEHSDDLAIYLRHLKNADKMLQQLTQFYSQQRPQQSSKQSSKQSQIEDTKGNKTENKETLLCFYGDHVPSMPRVYASTQYTDDNSDYFIWDSSIASKNKTKKSNDASDIEVQSLATLLLAVSDLVPNVKVRDKDKDKDKVS